MWYAGMYLPLQPKRRKGGFKKKEETSVICAVQAKRRKSYETQKQSR